MKEFNYLNIDEFMDDLERKAMEKKRKRREVKVISQLSRDYMKLKQWYSKKFWQVEVDLPERVKLAYSNEARAMLHAMSDKEVLMFANAHDGIAADVIAKRRTENDQQTTYSRKFEEVIAQLDSLLATPDEQE